MESLRQSTLECLYDQSCIDILALQPNISHPKPLPQSAAFLVNATVGSMFSQSLFVESWQRNASFERYCELCAPQSLTYTKEGRFRLAAIVTTSISAFGGLVILWELITPAFVKISSLFMWRRRKHPCILLEPTSSPATAAKASPRSPRKGKHHRAHHRSLAEHAVVLMFSCCLVRQSASANVQSLPAR